VVPLTDEQQIDYMLSEYLGAWQLGDTERMHKFYSEDVSVVNGGWAAPVIGWTNFLALYEQQKLHIQRVRLDRMNTYIKVNGTTAWTCYQWEFDALVDDTPTSARGQTTLVLVKRDTRVVDRARPHVSDSNREAGSARRHTSHASRNGEQPPSQ